MPQLTKLLFESAESGQLSGVLLALNNGTCPMICTDDGHTAMHLAAKGGHVEIVEELAKRGGLVNAMTHKGNSPLHGAAYKGQRAVCQALLDLGANRSICNENGETPLDRARNCGQQEVVALLEKAANDANKR